jgi:hypothetical protein
MNVYLVVIRSDALCLIGPFQTEAHAASWAEGNNPMDDPRWHTVRLGGFVSSMQPVEVFNPADGRAKAFMARSPYALPVTPPAPEQRPR